MEDDKKLNRLIKQREEWQKEVDHVLESKKERKNKFENLSWVEIKSLYTPLEISDFDYIEDLGFPGQYPYTRGVYPTMYRTDPWTRRQVIGFGGGEETRERVKFMMEQGQTGFSVVFDHPTNTGLDSDHPAAEGFVGREGTAIDSIQDMRDLLSNIQMEKTSLNLITANPALLGMVVAIAGERNIDLRNLAGTLQNYPLIGHTMGSTTHFMGGALFYSKRFSIDMVEYCSKNLPRWNSISIAVRNTREAGCTAVQEIAFGLGAGLAVVRACQERGMDPDGVAPRISFFLNSHRDFFEEVAKFRAMRRLWARMMRQDIGAKNPRSWRMRFHCQTSGDSMTRQQPLVNIIRGTLHGLAAVLGGCQSLHINSADEGYAIPIEETAKLSLRTQQVILDESGVADVMDPLGGSYYVEWLTNQLEIEAKKILTQMGKIGDFWDPVVQEWMSLQIAEASYRFQKEVENGERIIVGVNKHVEEKEGGFRFPLWREDSEFVKKQLQRLEKVRKERDPQRKDLAEKKLLAACLKGENILPPTIEAVKAYMTVGEITQVYDQAVGKKC
jgi:methylmalonyl-CoA mutase N-terminal domain/subunit